MYDIIRTCETQVYACKTKVLKCDNFNQEVVLFMPFKTDARYCKTELTSPIRVLDNIFVCRKICFDSIIRNETKIVQSVKVPKPYLLVGAAHTQRSSSFLTNVEYVVEAHIVQRPNKVSPKLHTLAEFYSMFNRRLNSGGYRHVPCLGQQEFSCVVRPYLEPFVKSVYAGEEMSLGIMYQKKVTQPDGTVVPLFADTKLMDGRVVYGNFFVPYMGGIK